MKTSLIAALVLIRPSLFGAPDPVKLEFGQGTLIRFTTPAPVLWDGERLPEPAFDAAGRALAGGLEVKRHIERVEGGYRVRVSVTNTRKREILLRSLIALQVAGQENMLVGGLPVSGWQIFRIARHKNDIPGPYRPTKWDDAARDAAVDSSGFTRADDPGESKGPATRFHSDPGFVVMPDGKSPSADLFIGFDGQTEHLNDVTLELDSTRTRLQQLQAVAEFDGVVVPPGATRSTHDLYIQTGKDRDELLAAHVERIKRRYGARVANQRSVFCTWYFYGPEILAGDLRKDLAEMKKRPVKFELFLIDYGWSHGYGDWNADAERFPEGMKEMADEIRARGLTPAIWSAPFLVDADAAAVKKYPDLLLKRRSGEYLQFKMNESTTYVVDPTAPSAQAFLSELCRRFTGWGYRYLKFDFLRAVVNREDVVFHDRTINRAQAYRRGMEILRKAAGDDVLIGTWGGLFEANAGIVNINRPGSDVRGHWNPVGQGSYSTRYPLRMRQTFARAFYDGKLWTSDQDALQLRRRTEPWRKTRVHISMGTFTDEEAFSLVVFRFLGGGMVQVSEKLEDLDRDRYDLYKMVIPAYSPVAKPFGGWNDYLPEHFVSNFAGNAGLPPWAVVSLCNWNSNAAKELAFRLGDVPGLPHADKYAAFEFRTQKFLGVFKPGDTVRLELPSHGARVVRLTPIRGGAPQLIGTDLNMSCGMEIGGIRGKEITLKSETREFPARFTFLELLNQRKQLDTVEYQPAVSQRR